MGEEEGGERREGGRGRGEREEEGEAGGGKRERRREGWRKGRGMIVKFHPLHV